MPECFISEPIEPVMEQVADQPIRTGEPILPRRFRWRGGEYRIDSVLETWKQYSGGSKSMPEHYLRKHWFRILASRSAGEESPPAPANGGPGDSPLEMKIYFERKARSKGSAAVRWWIFTLVARDMR